MDIVDVDSAFDLAEAHPDHESERVALMDEYKEAMWKATKVSSSITTTWHLLWPPEVLQDEQRSPGNPQGLAFQQ